ncbi:MAG: PAS domain-containing sensor histidine kinase, partial [Deltaproteobacteria bacterium]|nr:PAS domain-containing sensor histidine kinase [Deltaproteobacteria bacterium]
IISIAEMLKDQCIEKGENDEIPTRIIKEGDRIAEIAKNLLSFARDRKEEHSPTNIQDILSDSFGLVERQIIKDGIKLSTVVPSDLPQIKARSREIQQVFLNIISNARYALNKKFPGFHEDKTLEIKGEIKGIEGKRNVRLTFSDHGVGIPENIMDKICNPFFSTKPRGEGTGLGLSISHGIIKSHGGRLTFQSVPGEYARVIIDLPVNNAREVKEE